MCAGKEHNVERRCLSGNMCNDMFCHPQVDLKSGDLSPKHVGRFKIMMYNLQFYFAAWTMHFQIRRKKGQRNAFFK
jgi:hypothetical protein